MATLSSILAWKSHGQRSLAGYSPWGHKESDKTEGLNSDNNNKMHFQLPAKELVLLANQLKEEAGQAKEGLGKEHEGLRGQAYPWSIDSKGEEEQEGLRDSAGTRW